MKASHYYFQFDCQQFINVLKKVGLTIWSGKMIVIKATLSKYLGLDQATLIPFLMLSCILPIILKN